MFLVCVCVGLSMCAVDKSGGSAFARAVSKLAIGRTVHVLIAMLVAMICTAQSASADSCTIDQSNKSLTITPATFGYLAGGTTTVTFGVSYTATSSSSGPGGSECNTRTVVVTPSGGGGTFSPSTTCSIPLSFPDDQTSTRTGTCSL